MTVAFSLVYRQQGASWSEFRLYRNDEPGIEPAFRRSVGTGCKEQSPLHSRSVKGFALHTGNDPNPDVGEPYGYYLGYQVRMHASDFETLGDDNFFH